MVRITGILVGFLALLSHTTFSDPVDPAARQQAAAIFATTNARAGFVVHLGCGNGHLTAALSRDGTNLVHGLGLTHEAAKNARETIQSRGLYGSVSAEQLTGAALPYIDGIANLVISDGRAKVAESEIMRILAPRGIAYIKKGDTWTTTVKPVPSDTDEWTHYYHDASGNPVSNDERVSPPKYLQWEAGPPHTRSHEFTSSVSTVVTSNGRIFYFTDVGSRRTLREPADWRVIARDAFNGMELWNRPVNPWYSHLCTWTGAPRELQRRMVVDGDRVFATLGYFGEVEVLDAATGKTIRTLPGTRGAEEIIFHRGRLLVAIRKITDEKLAEFEKLAGLTSADKSPLQTRDGGRPLFRAFRKVERSTAPSIIALDPESGEVLWKLEGKDTQGLRPLSLRAVGDWVVYHANKTQCRNLTDGSLVWGRSTDKPRCLDERVLILATKKTIKALRTDTGDLLWTQDLLLSPVRDVFIIGDSVWIGGFKPFDTGSKKYTGPVWGPHFATERNLETGEFVKEIATQNPGHHHRCYDNVATNRYMLVGRRGTEFYDLKTGDIYWNSWARGVCRYGVMPANGFLYKPPHSCGCYITAMVHGFTALGGEKPATAQTGTDMETPAPPHSLERGPAYAKIGDIAPATAADWPTYRGNSSRYAFTQSTVPTSLGVAWQAAVGPKLTPPTVANGKAFVAIPEKHQVVAFDGATGKQAWRFTAGGRIDSPPTLYRGLALFGCRDGYVYCVKADDGILAWRFRASKSDRRTAIDGQLESLAPTSGSVLMDGDVLVFTAGRLSYLDSGIDLYRLEPVSGKMLSVVNYSGPDSKSDKPVQFNRNQMPGPRQDILSADAENLYLQNLVLSKEGTEQDSERPHLFALTGFLDDSWTHRSYWIYGGKSSISTGCSGQMRGLIYGRLLSIGDKAVFGYGRSKVHWSSEYDDGPYRLFARTHGEPKPKWTKSIPIQVNAMAVAGNTIFAAGAPGPYPGTLREEGKPGPFLFAVSAKDGSVISQISIPAAPVFDGLAVANGRVFITLEDGTVICMAGQ